MALVQLKMLDYPVSLDVTSDIACFLVEGSLFKVHRYFFQRDSGYFRNLFDASPCSDDQPAVLEDITGIDFERFLGVLYPTRFDRHSALSADEWTSVLALATRWSFTSISALAARELSPLISPIQKIALSHRYHYLEWLGDAYYDACKRGYPLTPEEVRLVGYEASVKISRTIEKVRSPASLVLTSADVVQMIRETFGIDEKRWPGNPRFRQDPTIVLWDEFLFSFRKFVDDPAAEPFVSCAKSLGRYPGFQRGCEKLFWVLCIFVLPLVSAILAFYLARVSSPQCTVRLAFKELLVELLRSGRVYRGRIHVPALPRS